MAQAKGLSRVNSLITNNKSYRWRGDPGPFWGSGQAPTTFGRAMIVTFSTCTAARSGPARASQ